jgi:hypothetical protein
MRLTTLLTALTAAILTAGPANAAIVLLGGFDGANDVALQSPTATDVSVTLSSSTGDITPGSGSFQSNDFTWGGTVLDVLPKDTNTRQIVQSGTVTPWSLTLTVTNNGSADVLLEDLHFRVKKDINNQGPPSATIAYTAGDLGSPSSNTYAIPNGITNHTVDLATLLSLADMTLGAGESATFTWTTDAPQDPDGNTGMRIDNFAISGEIVPEPGALALLFLGCLGLTSFTRCKR